MFTTTTRHASRGATGRFSGYRRSKGDITLLEISILDTGPENQDEQVIRLAVAGEIDIMTAGALRDTLIQTLHKYHPVRMDVSLADVTFMDASGVSALLRSAFAARQRGCAIRVSDPRPNVYKVLEITGLLEEFGLPRRPHPARRYWHGC